MASHETRPGRQTGRSTADPAERLSCYLLDKQNSAYAGTSGISANNRHAGFVPGYQNCNTGEICASCFADGRPAPIHLLDGLPESWVAVRDASGRVTQTVAGVVAGFLHGGRFYSREEAARLSQLPDAN